MPLCNVSKTKRQHYITAERNKCNELTHKQIALATLFVHTQDNKQTRSGVVSQKECTK